VTGALRSHVPGIASHVIDAGTGIIAADSGRVSGAVVQAGSTHAGHVIVNRQEADR